MQVIRVDELRKQNLSPLLFVHPCHRGLAAEREQRIQIELAFFTRPIAEDEPITSRIRIREGVPIDTDRAW